MKKFTFLLACMLLVAQAMFAQRTITGVVTSSEDNKGIPGVSVVVKGAPTTGAVTDANGKYVLTVPADAVSLMFSFIGFQTVEIQISGRSAIDVVLQPEATTLEELVVIGYGTQRKREVTGSITSIRGDELAKIATPSFESQLMGRSSGVQITSQTGVLGEVPRIRIRGVGSITSGTYPLIVVDGIPILTGDVGGYASTNALGDINPADIESIEVLKDGSATAIYGSRAANGVILITTKRGTAGKFQLNYNNYFGIAQPIRLFDLANETEFLELTAEMFENAGRTSPAVATGLNTDWQKEVLRSNAFQQDHIISLSGSTPQTGYYFSVGYSDQEGVTIPNDMSRFTFRANVDQKVTKAITFGAGANLARTQYNGQNTGENSLSGNVFSAIRQLPNTPVYNPDHPTGYNIDLVNPQLVGRWENLQTIDDNLPNIMYTLKNNVYGSKVNRGTLSFYGAADLLPFLNFRSQVGVDLSMTEGLLYWNPIHGDGASVKGRIYNTQTNFLRWNIQNILSFNKSFADVHNLSATLVQEAQKQNYNYFFAGGTNISDPHFRYGVIGGSYSTQLSSGSMTGNGILSYAGRLSYNYDNKYFILLSSRYDGLSALPKDNRWGFFPGVSVGWTVSREGFMSNVDFISDLKIRASYAEVGNSFIGNYPYLGLYSGVRYADYTGIAFSQMGNDQLLWETSNKYDIGLDASILDGKFTLTYDYFLNDLDGLILQAPTPPSFGVPGNYVYRNIGTMRNSGHELSVDARVISTRDLSWNVGVNLTLTKNEVTSLVDDKPIILTYTIIDVGESIRSVYGYDYVGVNKANGNPIYRKADGTMVQGNIANQTYRVYDPNNPEDVSQAATLAAADRKVFGSSLPTYFGAITSNLKYKNFDFSMLFRYSGGNYIMNRTRADLLSNTFTNFGSEMLGRWQSPDKPGDGWTPKLWYGQTNFINRQNETSGRFVEKADFLKLQNLVLGYTFPKHLLSRVGINGLRVFVSGSELFMITDYTGVDPEMEREDGYDYNGTPRQRTFVFGINFSL